MRTLQYGARRGALTLALLALSSASACSSAGALGSVLGSVLGGGAQQQQANQVSGTVLGVDSRSQSITLRQSNGQNIALVYDNSTKVVYQNQNYAVSNLENGDVVTARIQQTNNNSYYTDLVQVDQSVSSTSSGSNSNAQVQQLQGTVRQVDLNGGLFTIQGSNNVTITVSMPYNPTRADLARFQQLRNGDVVRFSGVYLNNTRVELRQFN